MISKNHIKFIQSLHSKKNREQEGLFIVEGTKLVTEFISEDSFEVKELFATQDYVDEQISTIKTKSVPYFIVSADELSKISLQVTPNKVLAVVYVKKQVVDVAALTSTTVLFLDDIRDPGNLGTIIRIADWFGIKNIICSKSTTELYNPKTIQASMGAVLRVSVVFMDFEDLISENKGIKVYGAILNGQNLYTSKLTKGIIVIGNEANGISKEVLKHITTPITIPAANNNGSESLNAANACAIICSEFHRQLNY